MCPLQGGGGGGAGRGNLGTLLGLINVDYTGSPWVGTGIIFYCQYRIPIISTV